ncbi:MAG: hypothetical protein MUE44_25910 [Oscillatoriaceae cyanobacterium Prado104]|nr:hypothetical protein [Oscillatoriaceae cyanobacterium Prado104]
MICKYSKVQKPGFSKKPGFYAFTNDLRSMQALNDSKAYSIGILPDENSQ